MTPPSSSPSPSRKRSPASRIDEIVVDPRDPSRCLLRLAGGTVLRLRTLDAERLGLGVGRLWDRRTAIDHRRLQRVDAARGAALRRLAVRRQPAAAVQRLLQQRGFSGPEIREAIRSLAEDGWLDDRRWAAERVAELRRAEPCSRAMLRRRIAAAGIPAAIARGVLDQAYPPELEQRCLAEWLAARRATRGTPRLLASLRRRGFPMAAISAAIREAAARDRLRSLSRRRSGSLTIPPR